MKTTCCGKRDSIVVIALRCSKIGVK